MRTRCSLPSLLALASLLGFPLSSRAATVVVTTLADGPPGSLRDAVAFAGTNAGGAVITFDLALSGQVIVLTNGEMVLSNQVTIDASALPEGITVSAGHLKGTLQTNWPIRRLFSAAWPGRLHRVFDVAGSRRDQSPPTLLPGDLAVKR